MTNEQPRPDWAQPKPKPTNIPDTHYAAMCHKCAGCGVYAMMVRNGMPWSTTGTTCYPCRGRGWVIRRKPGKRNKTTTAPVAVNSKSVTESPAWKAGHDAMVDQMLERRRESSEQLVAEISKRIANQKIRALFSEMGVGL